MMAAGQTKQIIAWEEWRQSECKLDSTFCQPEASLLP